MRRTVVVIFGRRIPLVCPGQSMTLYLTHELAEVSHNEKHRCKNQQPPGEGSSPDNSFHRGELTGRFLSCQELQGLPERYRSPPCGPYKVRRTKSATQRRGAEQSEAK